MMHERGEFGVSKACWMFLSIIVVAVMVLAYPGAALVQSPGAVRLSLPDLTLSQSDIAFSNDRPTDGEMVRIFATIHNVGDADASQVEVSFSKEYMNHTSEIGKSIISVISANTSEQTQIDFMIGQPGTYKITVCVDPDNKIAESKEDNNCSSRDLIEELFYIICEDNAHTIPPRQSTDYLITVVDNAMCRCPRNITLKITKPMFFGEWNSSMSKDFLLPSPGEKINVTLTVDVPETTLGMPSGGMTAPICVEAIMMIGHSPDGVRQMVCTYTTASNGERSVLFDIDPDTLNLKSKGRWVTAYLSARNASVHDIDVSSIRLQDVLIPERHDYQDEVLMLKFNRQDFKETVEVGDSVEVKISGEWLDGNGFEQYDYIRVIDPGKSTGYAHKDLMIVKMGGSSGEERLDHHYLAAESLAEAGESVTDLVEWDYVDPSLLPSSSTSRCRKTAITPSHYWRE